MNAHRFNAIKPFRRTVTTVIGLCLAVGAVGFSGVNAGAATTSTSVSPTTDNRPNQVVIDGHDHTGMDMDSMNGHAHPAATSTDAHADTAQDEMDQMIQKHHGQKPPAGVVLHGPKLDRSSPMPKEYDHVDVKEHRGDKLPLDLRFNDEHGQEVRLGDYFKKDRPVVLVLAYYECPMLCDVVMNGLSDVVKEMGWEPGKNFQIITVSIDPHETPQLATAKKSTYMHDLGKLGAPEGWHFLTGDQNNITALAEAIGFQYKWLESRKQFAHPAVLTIATPDGHISRYLYGVKFPATTLKFSLITAANGKVGSALDHLILTCAHFDASTGRYTASVMRIMSAGGALTLLLVSGGIGIALMREFRQKRRIKNSGH